LHCIYNLGLGVVAQGDKQVLLGGESIDYGPGQSMLTTIDLPVVSLKQNFVQALHGDDLADRAHMSPSTFRQHFRAPSRV
jgi:AraC-like DNA-binding protein